MLCLCLCVALIVCVSAAGGPGGAARREGPRPPRVRDGHLRAVLLRHESGGARHSDRACRHHLAADPVGARRRSCGDEQAQRPQGAVATGGRALEQQLSARERPVRHQRNPQRGFTLEPPLSVAGFDASAGDCHPLESGPRRGAALLLPALPGGRAAGLRRVTAAAASSCGPLPDGECASLPISQPSRCSRPRWTPPVCAHSAASSWRTCRR